MARCIRKHAKCPPFIRLVLVPRSQVYYKVCMVRTDSHCPLEPHFGALIRDGDGRSTGLFKAHFLKSCLCRGWQPPTPIPHARENSIEMIISNREVARSQLKSAFSCMLIAGSWFIDWCESLAPPPPNLLIVVAPSDGGMIYPTFVDNDRGLGA